MIVLAASLVALLVVGTAVGRRLAAPDESRATTLLRAALAAAVTLVVVEAGLGFTGRLGPRTVLLALAAVAALAVGAARRWPTSRPDRAPPARVTAIEASLVSALAALLIFRLAAGLTKTTFLYDTLSYHLHVPANWLAERRLAIVPAVFGDPAPAYAPSNGELWLAFLMAPLGSDALAGSGQIAAAALGGLAVVAAVREGGGPRAGALGAALAFLLVPEVWQQARTAMTDLTLAAFLLSALPFLFRLRRTAAPGDGLGCAAALGLGVGTKYVGAALALPFALAAAVALRRARPRLIVTALVLIVLSGGFWHLRNLLLTGNPLYPVAALGFRGLYDGTAMRAWDYHLPVGDVGALGAMLLASGLGFTVAAAIGLARARPPLEAMLVASLLVVFWLAVPYQESRFLFAAFGVAAVAIGRTAALGPPALGRGALALAIGGALIAYPAPERLALLPAGAVGGAIWLGLGRLAPRARRLALASGAALAIGGGAIALGLGVARYEARDPGYAVDTELDDAWRWVHSNLRDARIAYTGTNLAFPLEGPNLANRAFYVNVAGRLQDQLHDRQHDLAPRARPAAPTSPEPAVYRNGATFETWLANLRAARAGWLFVAALDPIVARNVASDDDGFPIERAWADAHPALFTPRYTSPAARIYAVRGAP